jgi:uncharacterized protein YqeY
MSLKEQLFADLKTAMKEKDTIKKDTIQLIRSGVLQIEKDNKVELDDEGVIEVISKQLKSRRDSLPDYEKSGRQDLHIHTPVHVSLQWSVSAFLMNRTKGKRRNTSP